jgi:hypothetical protein
LFSTLSHGKLWQTNVIEPTKKDEGTVKTTFKEDGSWEATTWEGTYEVTGGTGKLKNIKGSGTYRGKATAAEGASTEFEGEEEY